MYYAELLVSGIEYPTRPLASWDIQSPRPIIPHNTLKRNQNLLIINYLFLYYYALAGKQTLY